MNIESNYCRIAAVAGNREKLPLGKYALRNALVILSQAGNQI
jgi:ABC-type dipeptide/oligopeptide/nickel transport system permease component